MNTAGVGLSYSIAVANCVDEYAIRFRTYSAHGTRHVRLIFVSSVMCEHWTLSKHKRGYCYLPPALRQRQQSKQ